MNTEQRKWKYFLFTKNKLKAHKKVCENKSFCGIVLPSQEDNILEFHQYMK